MLLEIKIRIVKMRALGPYGFTKAFELRKVMPLISKVIQGTDAAFYGLIILVLIDLCASELLLT